MEQKQLEKIKQVQLEIMDGIDKVCRQNGITYYLVYGTLLGAVRHKGFIPWDVDIDIAIPRCDYERFKRVCKDSLEQSLVYCDYDYSRYFQQPHALVCKKGTNVYTKYDDVNPIVKNYGIYVDVFPLDNAPDDIKEREKHAVALKKIARFKEFCIPYSYSKSPVKRKIHHIISALLFFIPVKKINKKQQEIMAKYKDLNTDCLSTLAGEYEYNRQCVKRENFGTPAELEFEGRKYFVPSKYKEYLTKIYGDYMKLPPEEKRKANLDLFTRFEI